jgi:transposase
MARPYSEDLRERIVGEVEGGASRRATAAKYAVSISCVIKLMQRWQKTGSLTPGQMGGWRAHALSEHEAAVRALIAAQPDQTVDELQEALARQGIRVGRTSVWRFLRACGLTRKKRRSTPPSKTGPTSQRRASSGGSRSPS